MPAHCTNIIRTSHSYFVVMVDYGKRGLEAVVHPEDTRRDIVAQLASGESKHVAFIHHVDDGLVEDVTSELFDEAEALCRLRADDRPTADFLENILAPLDWAPRKQAAE